MHHSMRHSLLALTIMGLLAVAVRMPANRLRQQTRNNRKLAPSSKLNLSV